MTQTIAPVQYENLTPEQAKSIGIFTQVMYLPDRVEPPKFRMFEWVKHTDNRGVTHEGIIVGMNYLCALEALATNVNGYGWSYAISYICGNSPEEALTAKETDLNVWEEDLTSLEGA